MKEMEYTVEGGGPLLPFLLERVRGSRNHVKSLLTRGQVEVDGKTVTRHDHPLTPGQRVAVRAAPPLLGCPPPSPRGQAGSSTSCRGSGVGVASVAVSLPPQAVRASAAARLRQISAFFI